MTEPSEPSRVDPDPASGFNAGTETSWLRIMGNIVRGSERVVIVAAIGTVVVLTAFLWLAIAAPGIEESSRTARAPVPHARTPPDASVLQVEAELSVGPCVRPERGIPSARALGAGTADTGSAGPFVASFDRRTAALYLPAANAVHARILTYGDGLNPARVWDAETGQAITALEESNDYSPVADSPTWRAVWALGAFSADGSRVFMVSEFGDPAVWDAASGRRVAILRDPGIAVALVSMNADGSRVAIAGPTRENVNWPKAGILWDIPTGERRLIIRPDDEIRSILLNAAGTGLLAVKGQWGRVFEWRENEPASGYVDRGDEGLVDKIFFRDGHPFATFTKSIKDTLDESLSLWDLMKHEAVVTIVVPRGTRAALVPDGPFLVTVQGDGLTVIEVATGRTISTVPAHVEVPHDVSSDPGYFSADGARYGVMAPSGSGAEWDLATGLRRAIFSSGPHWLRFAVLSEDGGLMATWNQDGTGELRDIATGKRVTLAGGLHRLVDAASFSADRGRLSARDLGGNVAMWDTKDGARLRNEDDGMVDAAPSTVASPDGKRFVSRDKIGDVGTGKKARVQWSGRSNAIIGAVGWTREGRLLAVTCNTS